MKWIIKIYKKLSDAWYRMRLRNDNFTIMANSCIGGIMYHKLGKQFLSPMINILIHDVEFYKFLHNMDYYLSQPLVFIKSDETCPVAKCGDITLFFIHYKTEEEAAEKWYSRRKRINRDNFFIICSDRPWEDRHITYEHIASLKNIPCRGKVVFSTRHYDDIDYIVPLPKAHDGDWVNVYMSDKNKFGRWRWENAWDWVHWLNTGEIVLRK